MARMSFVDVALRLRGAGRFSAEVTKATAALEGMGIKGADALGAFAKKSSTYKHLGRQLTTSLTLPIAAIGGASVYAAMKWESAFTGVRKTVDATEPQLAKLNDQLIAMSLEIPVSATELASIAEAAGQLGIKTQAIAGFTRVMADLGATTNMTSTEAAESLARFANITQMSQGDFDRLGSTVADLGNKLAATETDIVNMGLRIAGAGNQVGLTEAQIMGFAGALSSVGIRAELGGTAISTAFLEANSAVIAGGAELNKWASVAGMSASKFRQQWNSNAGLAMTQFLEGLKRLSDSGVDVKARLEDLGLSGTRLRDVLMRASGAGDLLREALGLGSKAWRENNALQIEAEKRYATTEAQFQKLKNALFAMGIVIGSVLLPPLAKVAKWLGDKLVKAAKWFESQSKTVKAVLIGIAVAAALAGPILFALGVIASGVGAAMIVATSPVTLIALALLAMVVAVGVAYAKLKWFRDYVQVVFKILFFLARTLFTVWKTAIMLAVNALISHVKRFLPVWKAVIKGLVAAFNWFRKSVSDTVNWIKNAWGSLKSAASSVAKFITSRFQSVIDFFKGLPGKIRNAVRGAFDGLKTEFQKAIEAMKTAWDSLRDKLKALDIPGGPPIGIPGIPIPGAADGGTITSPGLTMVGERGPELLSLPKGASVIPLTDRVTANAVGGPSRIEVPVYLNGRQIALAVADEVSNARARA